MKLELDFNYCIMIFAVIILAIAALVLLLFEIQYFVRMIFIITSGRIFINKKKPNEDTTIYGMCTPSDLDFVFKHMNNARYSREMDFARIHFFERTGIHKAYSAKKKVALQAACVIKYRQPISLFTKYKITTKMIHWDEKSIYLEQQFVGLKDNVIKTIAYSKQGFVGVNAAQIVTSLMNKDITYKSEMSKELEHFIGCLDASSMQLCKKEE